MIRFLFPQVFALTLCCAASFTVAANTHSAPASKQRLLVKIDALLKKRMETDDDSNVVPVATLLTPARQLAEICANPELSLAGNDKRLTGRRSVLAKCPTRRYFLQIQVKAHGSWWVAKNSLPAGTVIQAGDIEAHSGSLDRQPSGLVFNPDRIVGQTTTRAIAAGKPVLDSQLRQPWRLRAGQAVDILAKGDGFLIRSQGKALANASVNDPLKVQTRTGQIFTGLVNADGQIVISLQQ